MTQILVVGGKAPWESWAAIRVRCLPSCASPARLPLYYRAANLLMHASVEEASSFATAEALSCGLPVLAHRAGSLPEMVSDGETGLLVQPRDPEALARTLRQLLADPALQEPLAQHVAAHASLDFAIMVDSYPPWVREIYAAWGEQGGMIRSRGPGGWLSGRWALCGIVLDGPDPDPPGLLPRRPGR